MKRGRAARVMAGLGIGGDPYGDDREVTMIAQEDPDENERQSGAPLHGR